MPNIKSAKKRVLITKKETTSYERQTALNDMIVLALESTLNI